MARWLVAGCGDVGTRAALRLAALGHEVFGLRRRPQSLPATIVGVAADLTDRATLADLPRGVDGVIYAPTPAARDQAAYRRTYVAGAANLIDALSSRPAQWLQVSSSSVWGDAGGAWVDEATPARPDAWNGRVQLEAERCVLDRIPDAAIVRLAGLYGPGREALIARLRAGTPVQRDPPQWTNRIHVDDAAAMLAHLATLGAGGLWIGVDGEPAPLAVVLDWLADRLALPPAPAAPPGGPANKRLAAAKLVASGFRHRRPDFRAGYAPLVA